MAQRPTDPIERLEDAAKRLRDSVDFEEQTNPTIINIHNEQKKSDPPIPRDWRGALKMGVAAVLLAIFGAVAQWVAGGHKP